MRADRHRELRHALVVAGELSRLAARQCGLFTRMLANPVVRYLGLVSYGIYLYHLAVVKKLDGLGLFHGEAHGLRVVTYLVLGVAGATAIATVSYYLVERPALKLKRLLRDPALDAARGEAIVEPAPVAPTAASRG